MASRDPEAGEALLARQQPARPQTYEAVLDKAEHEIPGVFRDTATDKYFWYNKYSNKYQEIALTDDNILVRSTRAITNIAQHPRVFQIGMAFLLCLFMHNVHSITKHGGSVPKQLGDISSALNATATQAHTDVSNIQKGYNYTVDFFQAASILLLSSSLAYSLKMWAGSIKQNYNQMKKMYTGLAVLGGLASLAVIYFGACIPGSAISSEAEFCTLRMERALLDNNSALYPIANAGLTLLATFIAAAAFNLGGLIAREENAQAARSFARQVGGRAVMGVRTSFVSVRNIFTLSQGVDSLAARVKRLEDNEKVRQKWVPVATAPSTSR